MLQPPSYDNRINLKSNKTRFFTENRKEEEKEKEKTADKMQMQSQKKKEPME